MAILNGFRKCEETFLEHVRYNSDIEQRIISDSSGSCANVALFVDKMCYIANVGDSRSIMSTHRGKYVKV